MRGQRHAPAAPYPEKDPVPIVQEAGWASGPVWTGAENLAPLRFDPRTVQSVGSRYTDYATRPTRSLCYAFKYIFSEEGSVGFTNVSKGSMIEKKVTN